MVRRQDDKRDAPNYTNPIAAKHNGRSMASVLALRLVARLNLSGNRLVVEL